MIDRFDHSEEISDYLYLMPQNFDFHEFGCASLSTMERAINVFKQNGKTLNRVFGYDSWLGLPDTIKAEWFHPDWKPGSFSALREFGVNTVEELMPLLHKKVGDDVIFINGWYKDTLNKETADKYQMTQAGYVNIDVDIYSSTMEVLTYCFDYGIFGPGTVIRYDDWLSGPEWVTGNSKAHKEIREKYHAVFDRLSRNVFQLLSFQKD